MSCFVLSDRVHAAIADTLDHINMGGFNNYGFTVPDYIAKLLNHEDGARRLYGELYRLNVRAYCDRYNDTKTEPNFVPDMPEPPKIIQYSTREYRNGVCVIQQWHYKLLKLLDCYLYQCSEGDVPQKALFIALDEFRDTLRYFIINNNENYNQLPWGDI